nr:NADH dehydrogenase subunit 4 [Armandia sp. GK-2021]
MFKLIIPVFFSFLGFRAASVGVSWAMLSLLILFCPDFIQSFLCIVGFVKPVVVLTFWVGAMMVYASAPSFSNQFDLSLVACVSSLVVLLLAAFTSKSLISLYLFFESTLIPTLFLIYGWGNQPERMQASIYLLLYTVIGSLPLLLCIGVLWGQGSISTFLPCPQLLPFTSSVLWLMHMIAFFIKMPMYPAHLWLPKAHVEAPLAGSMALAGVLLKLGALGMIVLGSFSVTPAGVCSLIISLSLWGGVCTSVICLRQADVKALIAYSSIGHMAMVLAGILTMTEFGVKGAVVVVVAHGLSSPAMLSFANMVYEMTFSRSLVICKGVLSVFPAVCLLFFLLSASNMAAPPFINLVGEIWLIMSILSLSSLCSTFVVLMSFLVGAYTLYLYTSLSHGSISSLGNPGHLFSGSNFLIMFMQLWPLVAFIANLGIML